MTNALDINEKHLLNDVIADKPANEIAANPFNHIEVISDDDEFFALRDQWTAINDNAEKGTVFSSWEWVYTWWEVYKNQGKRSLYILTCTNTENELLGIAPLQIIHNPKKYFPSSRQLVMLATGETDNYSVFGEYMDFVIKEGHETAVLSSLSDFLWNNNNLWDGINFQQQLADSHVSKLFVPTQDDELETMDDSYPEICKHHVADGFRTLIDLPETYKEYLMGLNKKKRSNITRLYSRLEKEQEFTLESVTSDTERKAQMEGKPSAIEILAELNRTRRGNMDKDSVFSSPSFEEFHQRLLKRLLPLNKVSFKMMKFDDEPVAALYSFIDKDMVHAYQSGFETEVGHRYSLLTTMLTQEISSCIDNDDVAYFNFMYADNEATYKRHYSGTTEEMYNVYYGKRSVKHTLYRYIHGPLKQWVKKQLNIQ